MNDVILVVGLSGVGKSTVLEEAMQRLNKEYKLVNYGDRMLEIAQTEGLVERRDALHALDIKTQKRLQTQAAEGLAETAAEVDTIVETHAVIRTPSGYLPGVPRWTIEQLDPNRIAVIEATPDEIRSRRADDSERDRTMNAVEAIAEQQEIAREMSSTAAVLSGAYLTLIQNRAGKVDDAAEALAMML